MDATTRFDTQIVGALPIVPPYLERLGMARTIDQVVPWEGKVPLGTLVEVLILNRLLSPQPLFRIDTWAEQSGVAAYYHLKPGQLNDDRLGRALERLAEHQDAIQTALVLQAVREFGVDVSQVHYDITDVELFGAYEVPEGQAPPTPLPAYGRTKSGRKDVKEVQLGLNASGDGGVPLLHKALDGNAAEATTHVENLRRLRQVLPKGKLLYIADTKLDTSENLLEIEAGGGRFLCGGVFTEQLQAMFLRHRKKLGPVLYYPKSQEKLPEEERDEYQAFELEQRLQGEVKGQRVRLRYRLIFVWSEAKARQEAQTRERHLAKIQEQFATVQRTLGRYSLKTREAILRRLEGAKGRYSEGKLLRYELTGEEPGTFALAWRVEPKALAEWQHLEGVYVLKTNLSSRACPLSKTLAKYREQSQVERRFAHLKGPLAVAPMFLKNPARIGGLLCVLVWALMVMALMERQVRRNLKGKPLYGLYPENRPSPSPTGPSLLRSFSTLCIVIEKHGGKLRRRLAEPSPIQRILLQLLDIPPTALKTFRRRCGM